MEFVHPDLKDELSKQDEDPNNPWVWLTSYSRIPVGGKISDAAPQLISNFSWRQYRTSVPPPRPTVRLARRGRRDGKDFQVFQE